MLARNISMSRSVIKNVLSVEVSEGIGARVRRSIGRPELTDLDPFLMLDEFSVDPPAGFPDHPHRGFETVTYMLEGSFQHEDFCGHKGIINPGDLQWMTAGRGVVHCEVPYGTETGHGLQLWVNLAKENKMVPPTYQEHEGSEIPSVTKDGVTVKVIAGESHGVKSPVHTRTPTMYLDFKLEKGATLTQAIPAGWTAFVYMLSGSACFGPSNNLHEGNPHCTLVLSKEEEYIEAVNKGNEVCHFVLVGGKPLNEPIVHRGPFVMNTESEIQQTINDLRSGKNGFENAVNWQSEYVKNRK